jgi:hypothetical protein
MPSENELEKDGLAAAHRIARELDEGVVQPIPGEEVRRKGHTIEAMDFERETF